MGGISFAQAPQSARHGGMPSIAIGSGAVDFVLPPEGIARRRSEIGVHPYLAPGPVDVGDQLDDASNHPQLSADASMVGD